MITVDNYFDQVPLELKTPKAKEVSSSIKMYDLNFSRLREQSRVIQRSKGVQTALRDLYFNKCAYCETKLDMLNIMTYRPKSVYPWLILEWSNLLPSCQACNVAQGVRFPVEHPLTSVPNDMEQWRADSKSLLSEKPALLHPAIDRSSIYFHFDELGYILPSNNDIRAVSTIEIFNLNRQDLLIKRRNKIKTLQKNLHSKILTYGLIQNDIFNLNNLEFTGQFFSDFIESLVIGALAGSEFSLLGYNIVSRFEEILINPLGLNVEQSNIAYFIRDKFLGEIYENNIYNLKKSSDRPINMGHGGPIYISDVNIKNFFCIEDIQLSELAKRKEIYILGENGDGKTLVLQALLLGIKWAYIKNKTDKKDTGIIHDLVDAAHDLKISIRCTNKAIYSMDTAQYIDNVFAYGVHRAKRNSPDFVDKEGFLSLFSQDTPLIDPIEWLKELDRKSNYDSYKGIDLKSSITLFEDLLGKNVKISISQVGDISFLERKTLVNFQDLSEGYKSVLTWVSDLLSRLMAKQPLVKSLKEYSGVVLVDEVDLHLHPRWSKSLARKLRRWFPKIQFVFSTHSPSMVMGASNDAVFYRIYKENGIAKVSEPFYNDEMSTMMLNSLVTSPLFGLDDAHMSNLKNEEVADPSENFLHRRIYEIVEKQVNALKSAGKTYVDPDSISIMIEEALKNFSAEE